MAFWSVILVGNEKWGQNEKCGLVFLNSIYIGGYYSGTFAVEKASNSPLGIYESQDSTRAIYIMFGEN